MMVDFVMMATGLRNEFFRTENIIRRASDIEEDEDSASSGDEKSTGQRSVWSRKSLMEKVKIFVNDKEKISDLTKGMDVRSQKTKETLISEKEKATEARGVYAVQDESTREVKNICFKFQNLGKCEWGKRCRFSHDAVSETIGTSGKDASHSSKAEEGGNQSAS